MGIFTGTCIACFITVQCGTEWIVFLWHSIGDKISRQWTKQGIKQYIPKGLVQSHKIGTRKRCIHVNTTSGDPGVICNANGSEIFSLAGFNGPWMNEKQLSYSECMHSYIQDPGFRIQSSYDHTCSTRKEKRGIDDSCPRNRPVLFLRFLSAPCDDCNPQPWSVLFESISVFSEATAFFK